MATPLTVTTGQGDDDVVVLTVTGEIDLSNIEAFAGALDSAAPTREATSVTVDLSGVEYLDSGAINVLFGNAGHIRVIANPILMPVLKISGLTNVASVELAG
jgi:anti-anti-sigma factor